jgi:hypothetical protein
LLVNYSLLGARLLVRSCALRPTSTVGSETEGAADFYAEWRRKVSDAVADECGTGCGKGRIGKCSERDRLGVRDGTVGLTSNLLSVASYLRLQLVSDDVGASRRQMNFTE